MAETSEGGPKPSDFFVGVVDLFAIVLPGALLTFLIWRFLEHTKPTLLSYLPDEGARAWVTFAIASYVLGHFVFAIGSFLFDPLYDCSYKLWFGSRNEKLRARAETELQKYGLPAEFAKDTLKWAEACVRVQSPSAACEVDRLEADSKFFRSLTTLQLMSWPAFVFLIQGSVPPLMGKGYFLLLLLLLLYKLLNEPPEWAGFLRDASDDKATSQAEEGKGKQGDVSSKAAELLKKTDPRGERPGGSEGQYMEGYSAEADHSNKRELKFPEREGKGKRVGLLSRLLKPVVFKNTLTILLVLVVFNLGKLVIDATADYFFSPRAVALVICYLTLLLSTWRFMQRRLKRTEVTYEFLIVLANLPERAHRDNHR